MGPGLQERLRALASDGAAWVHLGTVDVVEAHDAWGYSALVTLQPDGRQVEARLAVGGAGSLRGAFWPVAVGDVVLVLLPGGDPSQAVAIAGLTSREASPPASWDNAQPQVVHPSGLHVRTSGAGSAPQFVVTADFLDQLSDALGELAAGVTAGTPTPTPITTALILSMATLFRSTALKTQ
jgi:hypothetical protein